MKKFNVTFSRPLDHRIESELNKIGARISFYDEYIPDFAIIMSESIGSLEKITSVRDVTPTSVGQLLEGRKKAAGARGIKVIPTPSIDLSTLHSEGLYGLAAKVAVIDSGYNHELCGNVAGSINFSSGSTDQDLHGHGSLVISLIKHFAPAAQIYSARVCVNDHDVDEENVHRALKWARSIEGLRIVNMSLGFYRSCSGICSLARTVNKMAADGYIITVAAGNKPEQTCSCPGCADGVITVGGLNHGGAGVWESSSRGHTNSTKPDLVAPSQGIEIVFGEKGPYRGTSFAAPVVAGIAASLLNLIHDTTKFKQYLVESCVRLCDIPVRAQGYGRLDVPNLMEVVKVGEKVSAVDK